MNLHIKCIEAADIPSMDLLGKSDPYLKLTLNNSTQVWTTKHINNSNSPVWNEEFDLPITTNGENILTIELFDKDTISQDDLISSRKFDVKRFPVNQIVDNWYTFEPAQGVKTGGRIRLQMAYESAKKKTLRAENRTLSRENFAKFDKDGNGTLDKNELSRFLVASGIDVQLHQAIFSRLDQNDDNRISFDELVENI